MLATTDKTGDYNWQFGRKVFVIFAGVNLIDIFFYLYAYRRLRSWSFVKWDFTVIYDLCDCFYI